MCVCVCVSWKSLNQQNHMCFLEPVPSQISKEENFPRRYLSSQIATVERRSRDFVFLGASCPSSNSKSARDPRIPSPVSFLWTAHNNFRHQQSASVRSDYRNVMNASVGRKAVNKRFLTSLFWLRWRSFCSGLMEEFRTRGERVKSEITTFHETSLSA